MQISRRLVMQIFGATMNKGKLNSPLMCPLTQDEDVVLHFSHVIWKSNESSYFLFLDLQRSDHDFGGVHFPEFLG